VAKQTRAVGQANLRSRASPGRKMMTCDCQVRPPSVVRSTRLGSASTMHTPGAGQRTATNIAEGFMPVRRASMTCQVLPLLIVLTTVPRAPTARHWAGVEHDTSFRAEVVWLVCTTQRGCAVAPTACCTEPVAA